MSPRFFVSLRMAARSGGALPSLASPGLNRERRSSQAGPAWPLIRTPEAEAYRTQAVERQELAEYDLDGRRSGPWSCRGGLTSCGEGVLV
jgi:hypothetical protein